MTFMDYTPELNSHNYQTREALSYLVEAFNCETATGIGAEAACDEALRLAGLTVGELSIQRRIADIQDSLKTEAARDYAWRAESVFKQEARLFHLNAKRALRHN